METKKNAPTKKKKRWHAPFFKKGEYKELVKDPFNLSK